MAYKYTNKGNLDVETTNVFMCDAPEDLAKIPAKDINLGSVAVVIDPFDMLMAKSDKTWVSLAGGDEEEQEGD